MTRANENSIHTLARWAWDIFVVSNTISALTTPAPKAQVPDVEEIRLDNQLALDALQVDLKALAGFDESLQSAWDLEQLVSAVETDVQSVNYPDRVLQEFLGQVKALVRAYKARVQELTAKEQAAEEADARSAERRFTAYRKANGLPHPKRNEWIAVTVIFTVVILLMWKRLFS